MKKYRVLIINTSDGENFDNVNNLVNIFKDSEIVGDYEYKVEVCVYHSLPKNLSTYHLIMLSGRLKSDSPSTNADIKHHYTWLKEYNGPLIAICGGYQRWLQVLGGKLEKVKNIEKDLSLVNMDPLSQIYNLPYIYSKHSYFISINNVPRILNIIGITKGVAIVRHKKYLQYGFQGHPEKTTRPFLSLLISDIKYKPMRLLYLPIHIYRMYHAKVFATIFFNSFLESLNIYYQGWK